MSHKYMHHHILLRKGTLEKLQKIPPKMTIFIMIQHYTKKNRYSEIEKFIGTTRFYAGLRKFQPNF